jgi:hypothetical protein
MVEGAMYVFYECDTSRAKIPSNSNSYSGTSVHLTDKLIYVGFPITEVSTFDIVLEFARPPPASGVREFERPKEI